MKIKTRKLFFILMILALAAFVVLKIMRGMSTSEAKGGIWNIIQIVFIAVGLVGMFKCWGSYSKYPFMVVFLVMMTWMWLLASVPFFLGKWTVSMIFGYLTVPYGALVTIAFFWAGKKNPIEKYPLILTTAFYAAAVLLFFFLRMFRMGISEEMGQLADVYYLLTLLPLVFIYTPKKWRILPFMVVGAVTMMTGKRAGFLALAVIMVLYFLLPNPADKDKHVARRIFLFALLAIVMIFVITSLSGKFNLNMMDRLDNMGEDGGSGRLKRWTRLWNNVDTDFNPLQILFGHGWNATVILLGGHAHNDFLEIFYDYGIITLLLYLAFFVFLFRQGISMYKAKYYYAREFMCSFVAAIFLAFFSFFAIDSMYITCSGACLGLIMADWDKFKKSKKEQALING